jgi:Flp pilus assembly protein TadD
MAGAEAHLKKAISIDPNAMDAYLALAQFYGKSGRLPEATAQLELMAAKQPNSVSALTLVGLLHHYRGNVDAAKEWYEKALAVDPTTPLASNNLAYILVQRNQELDRALQLAQQAKAKMPTRHEFNDTLGWVQVKRGLNTLAVTTLREAVAQQPNNASYHYHLGMAYLGIPDRSNARTSLLKALELDPKFEGADDARKALDSISK